MLLLIFPMVTCSRPPHEQAKRPLSARAASPPICSSCAHHHIQEAALSDLVAYLEGQAMKLITAIFAITVALQLTGSITELVLWWM
jgi:hypothetical protein